MPEPLASEETRAFLRRTVTFFNAIAWTFLALGLAATYLVNGVDPASPRGLLVGALAAAYSIWYFQFLVRRRPWAIGRPRWGLVYLIGSVALAVTLERLSPPFVALVWVGMGQSVAMIGLPWGAAAATAISLLALALTGAFSSRLAGLEQLIEVGSGLLMTAVWVGMAVSLYLLVQARFRNERLIAELREAHRRLEAGVRESRELAVLRERARLAREIHDGLGHTLTLIAVKAEAAGRLRAVDPERAQAQLESIKELARGGVADLKRSVANLRAPELARRTLSGAVADLAADYAQQAGWKLDVATPEALPPLPAAVEEALWRVAQEALANVLKHARAASVRVRLERAGDRLALTVADDGVGLPAGPVPGEGHFGIRGMHERIEALGGRFSVRSTPGAGTTVTAEVPAGFAISVAGGATAIDDARTTADLVRGRTA